MTIYVNYCTKLIRKRMFTLSFFKKTLSFYLISSDQREDTNFQSSHTVSLMVDTKYNHNHGPLEEV